MPSALIRQAIVRRPGPDATDGLTTQSGVAPCLEQLRQQHATYCETLTILGLELIHLPAAPGFPDAYFVEDTAVVTPEVAVITRPGAPERRGEERAVARALAGLRRCETIEAPGTLEGGDVLVAGRHVIIGLSRRTNRHGADQLVGILSACGYRCSLVKVGDGLHLKSSVGYLGDGQLLLTAFWAEHPVFAGYTKILVDPSEIYACNTLLVNDHLIMPKGYPQTRLLLEATGKPLLTLETSQIRRMDGGLTCLSIRF
ncbi:MAG: arginine deiminase family protein [Desulfobacterales bacterium]|jgi:dimethylargininase